MIFETKKVPLETLGEYLAAVRQSLQLSVADVEQKTGICDKYLLNLEAGSYHQLPPDVYVLGFLKKLADLYSIPHDVLLSQYKKEREIINNVAHKVIAPDAGWKTKLSGLVITPKMITLTGGISLALIAVFYLIFQVLMINRTPSLKIAEPSAGSVVNGSAVSVIGVTDPGSTVAINGQNVFVDSEGNFRTTLGTAAGQKELVVTSQNKFGKKAEEKILVMVEASTMSQHSEQKTLATTLKLELKFSRTSTININRDGVDLDEETIPAEGVKTIEAQNKIVLKTSDAGSVSAILNGKNLGVLGRNKEELIIPFTLEHEAFVKTSSR